VVEKPVVQVTVERVRRGVVVDPDRSEPSIVFVFILLVLAGVRWRSGALFDGGIDSVVAAKGLLLIIALMIAGGVHGRAEARQPIRTPPVVFLGIYLAISSFGAWASGAWLVSGILAARVAMLALIVLLVATSVSGEKVLRSLFAATTFVAGVAALTGLPTLASGRLGGGFPQIHSNELAMLCAVSALGVLWRLVRGDKVPGGLWLFLMLVGTLWLTGSRSSFIAAMVGIAILLAHARRIPPVGVVALHIVAAALTYVVLMTDLFLGFVRRGGRDGLSTVRSRAVGWEAAVDFTLANPWRQWIGSGLQVQEVAITGQFWSSQTLDGSWISSLVHGGFIGVTVLTSWAVWSLVVSRHGRHEKRMFLSPLLAYVLIRSTLESGLVASTAIFVIFFTASTVAERSGPIVEVDRFRARSSRSGGRLDHTSGAVRR